VDRIDETADPATKTQPGRRRVSGADRFIFAYVLLSALLGICYVAFALLK
jgi:hypothetical protein